MKFITSNKHKFDEIREVFNKAGIQIEWLKLKYDELQEDFTESISYKSALSLKGIIDGNFFLEDTGLYIRSLSGFPGPYSSFVSKTISNDGLLKLLEAKDRSAYFKTVVSLCVDRRILQFGGILNGKIAETPSGENGFGFDPVFIPDGLNKTLADIGIKEKNEFSHRSRAIKSVILFLKENSGLSENDLK